MDPVGVVPLLLLNEALRPVRRVLCLGTIGDFMRLFNEFRRIGIL